MRSLLSHQVPSPFRLLVSPIHYPNALYILRDKQKATRPTFRWLVEMAHSRRLEYKLIYIQKTGDNFWLFTLVPYIVTVPIRMRLFQLMFRLVPMIWARHHLVPQLFQLVQLLVVPRRLTY